MPDDWSDAVAAVRAEWRAEEETWSRAALEQWEHGRGLADVAARLHAPGRHGIVRVRSVTWSGVDRRGRARRRPPRRRHRARSTCASRPTRRSCCATRSGSGGSGRAWRRRGHHVRGPVAGARRHSRCASARRAGALEGSLRIGRDQVRADRPRRRVGLRADRVGLVGTPARRLIVARQRRQPAPAARRAGSASPARRGSGGRGSGPRAPSAAGTRRSPAAAPPPSRR